MFPYQHQVDWKYIEDRMQKWIDQTNKKENSKYNRAKTDRLVLVNKTKFIVSKIIVNNEFV